MILLTNGAPDDDRLFVAWCGPQMLFRAFGDGAAVEQLEALGVDEPRSLLEAARTHGVVEIEEARAEAPVSLQADSYSQAA
jgi:hypothetical protein